MKIPNKSLLEVICIYHYAENAITSKTLSNLIPIKLYGLFRSLIIKKINLNLFDCDKKEQMDGGPVDIPLSGSNTISDNTLTINATDKPKAKRGRRSKKEIAEMKEKEEQEKLKNANNPENSVEAEKPAPKKERKKAEGWKNYSRRDCSS